MRRNYDKHQSIPPASNTYYYGTFKSNYTTVRTHVLLVQSRPSNTIPFHDTSHEDKRRSMHRHCSVYAWNELQPHTASNTNDNTFKVKAHSNTNMYALFVTRYEHVRAVRPGPTRHRSIRSIQSRQCHCSVFLDGKPWREITKSYSIERQYHLHIQAHSNTNVRSGSFRASATPVTYRRAVIAIAVCFDRTSW